ncbi:PH domain-containing protein [Virgibacillus halodenitrificans]|uniref:PH domain-containing protein n=1 Tax=Virgibacillus halodenitrificans TaxID=1482 RepID=UPI0007619C91|nr:PH domain-containing protein [Virgibacillus halodenitrificans]MCJ0933219.1 PH domain-containing protein [Virgibacillus halodenitrificans]
MNTETKGPPLPTRKLENSIVKVWRMSAAIEEGIGLLLLAVLLYLDYYFAWPAWIGWILIVFLLLTFVYSVWSVIIRPYYLHKNWRYDLNEAFLQLKSGAILEQHQLIPMAKIQAVSTKQGPLLRKYGLFSIEIMTMGTSHTIPGIPEKTAIEVRNQIAIFAKVKEAEE